MNQNATLYGKVWQDGQAEPASWTLDAQPLTGTFVVNNGATGEVGLRSAGYPALNGGVAVSGQAGTMTASYDNVIVSTVTASGVPPAPTGLTASSYSWRWMNLSWASVAGAASYTIERSASGGAFATLISGVTAASYTDKTSLANTAYQYRVKAVNASGISAASNTASRTSPMRSVSDFDGDGKTDLVVTNTGLRAAAYKPSNGGSDVILTAPAEVSALASSIPVTTYVADLDGDGRSEFVWTWSGATDVQYRWKRSSDAVDGTRAFGATGGTPFFGDFDGDKIDDIAVFQASIGNLYFNLSRSSDSAVTSFQYVDNPAYTPVPADFNGDGRTDVGLFYSIGGTPYQKYRDSATGSLVDQNQFGPNGASPIAGDFDGDGKADRGVYTSALGRFYFDYYSTKASRVVSFNWGNSAWVPVVGDFDGDGSADIGQFDQATCNWQELRSSQNPTYYYDAQNYNSSTALVIYGLPPQPVQFGWPNQSTDSPLRAPRKR